MNLITIEVAYAQAEEQQLITVSVEQGTCARAALIKVLEQALVSLEGSDALLAPQDIPLGVYGLIVEDDYILKEGDRLEIYRPLVQDPMERRRRVAKGVE